MDQYQIFSAYKKGLIIKGSRVVVRNIGERTIKEIFNLDEDLKTFDFSVEEEEEGYMSPSIERIININNSQNNIFSDVAKNARMTKIPEVKTEGMILPQNAFNYLREYKDRLANFDPEINKAISALKKYKDSSLNERKDILADIIMELGRKLDSLISNE